ncbi:chromosome segregation ATPase [Thermostichus sp. MS-CIW-40]|jgi:chromosome segregation ATPase
MMPAGEPTLRDVLSVIEEIRQDVEEIRQDVEGLRQDVSRTNERLEALAADQAKRWAEQERRWAEQGIENRVILERIDTYQKASAQVVNLAFALIGAATVALVGIVLRLAVSL